MELYERIRREHRWEGTSIRELARRHKVHRRVVRQALASAVPPARKTPERVSPVLGEHEATIRRWLTEDLQVRPKQRHTARRIWQRLVTECDAQVAESTVRARVAEIRAELASSGQDVPIVQQHAPGAEAEVDFGEFDAWIDGTLLRLWLFHMRLSCSGRSFAIAFANQAQEAFFEGHVLGFAHFGGVPGRVRYDNLKAAVVRILRGRDRVENERFIALRSHYGFDSFFCEPGKAGAHEKGGVEGEVGRFRRAHLVPVPRVGCLDELNTLISQAAVADDARVITGRAQTVGDAFAAEAPLLGPLPCEPFDSARLIEASADAKARVCVLQAHYSVPARYARRRLRIRLGARHLEVLAPGSEAIVAVHERSLHKGVQHLQLDHYLEILARKPGALPGATALAQAKASGAFTELHQAFWDAARARHGDAEGTRALIEVLLLHRRMPAVHVAAGLTAALRIKVADASLVAIEARRAAGGHGDRPGGQQRRLAKVIPLSRRPDGWERPAPDLAGYDDLLDRPGNPDPQPGPDPDVEARA
ncbi:MAG: IS21 family transposase [Pseudonocardiaceae bacterium]